VVVAAVCDEPIDLFVSPDTFEVAPVPTSARETLSKTKNRHIKRRVLEKAELDLRFIVWIVVIDVFSGLVEEWDEALV
jgi:hypothetical protein